MMTSTISNLIILALLILLTSSTFTSCGPAGLGIDDTNDCSVNLKDFQESSTLYLAAIQTLSADGGDVSQADCDQFKSSSRAYLGALESYIDCIDIQRLVSSKELEKFRDDLRTAETEIDNNDCK